MKPQLLAAPRRRNAVGLARVGLALLVVMMCLTATPAQPRGKPPNFGGIPEATLTQILTATARTRPNGVTAELAFQVLEDLVREEHSAANPGCGVAGVLDTLDKLKDVQTKIDKVQKGNPSEEKQLVKELDDAINDLARFWNENGPPAPGTFTVGSDSCRPPQ